MANRVPSIAEAETLVIEILSRAAGHNKVTIPDQETEEWSEDMDPRADFDCVELPGISLEQYCKNFIGNVNRPELWPLALILTDKLCRVADMSIHAYNAHRLVLTAFCIAVKISSDYCGVTPVMAHCGGVATEDLISMEVSFLFLLDWRLNVAGGVYNHVMQELPNIKVALQRAARDRGTDVFIIPDDCMPAALRLEHTSAQPMMPHSSARHRASVAATKHRASVLLSPEMCSRTAPSEDVLSAHSFNVTPLTLLPMPEATVVMPPALLSREDAAPSVPPEQLKPRRVSLALSIPESVDREPSNSGAKFKGLPISPRALGRSRSNGGRFCSMKLTTPRAPSPRGPKAAAVLNVQPPPAAVPRPPPQAREGSCPRPSFAPSAHSAPVHPSSGGARQHSVGVQSAPAGHRGSSSTTGQRARIEAALAFTSQNGSNGSLV